jgi:hypothetical protein
MYYTGLDPLTWKEAGKADGNVTGDSVKMEKVYVARDPHEKAMQRALIQYRDPANYDLVKEALLRTGRTDLIGFGDKCLIPPRQMKRGEPAGRHTDPNNRKSDHNNRKSDHDNRKSDHDNRKNDHNNRKNGHGRTVKTSDNHHGKDGARHGGAPAKKRQTKR